MEISSPRNYNYGNGQLVFMVKLAQDYESLDVFLGEHVINGVAHTVIALQKSIHAGPWRAGEDVGLVVNT